MSINTIEKSTVDHVPIISQISPWLSSIVYNLGAKLILPFYFKNIIITGQEHIPRSGAVIVAPTHRARWDALIVPYAVGRLSSGRDLHFMVSANEMKGLQGWYIRKMGGFPVNTERPQPHTLNHSFELLSNGEMVVIFPEGGIFRGAPVQPLKRGVAKIALDVAQAKADLPITILPVSVKYSEDFPRRGCSVTVTIGQGLNVANYRDDSPRKSSFKLTEDLENALKNIHEI
ncbi:MAG: 1-acyl-sn-glycerol-3-phosphate acyltransferase [Cyanobacterium sp. T60_A2020_053]|nr:1-acyl-sn-glycerol-3-phosphate acyltransferase [Cyanobacterium sp. T60_A2020_053]